MKFDKIIGIVRKLNEEAAVSAAPTNNASGGAIAGLPPDQPPVRLNKKRRPTPIGRYGTRRTWKI
jgi:hypothetical protein